MLLSARGLRTPRRGGPQGRSTSCLLDPPYGQDDMAEALDAAAPLVAPDGLLVLEHARRDAAPADAASIMKTRDILSGDSALTFLRGASGTKNRARERS